MGRRPGARGAGTSLTRGLKGYWLDFPGNPLQPGCTYSEWQESIARHDQPYVYAHVAPDPHGADRLAVQYWFFYLLNDWKNKHEGDWEMIQLEFDVGTAERALAAEPAHATYSQHSGAERVEWTSDGLQRVGDHPVVYVSQGSHANYLHSGVFLGRGGARASAATTRGATSTPTSKPRASSCSPTLPRRGRSGSPTGGTGASR